MVASQTGFSIGDYITLDPSTKMQEVVQVVGFGSLILKSPLQYNHTAGAIIKKNPPTTTETTTTPAPVLAHRSSSVKDMASFMKDSKKLLYVLAIVVALIFCLVFVCCAIAHLGTKKKTRKRGKIDEIADREQMYDLEEPPGPTDSLINSSPYMEPETDRLTNASGSVYMDAASLPHTSVGTVPSSSDHFSVGTLVPSHQTIPPLVPSFRVPPAVPPRVPMVQATRTGYTSVSLRQPGSLRIG